MQTCVGAFLDSDVVNHEVAQRLSVLGPACKLVGSLAVETLFRPHGPAVLRRLFSRMEGVRDVVFVLNGHSHWSLAICTLKDGAWALHHVDSLRSGRGRGLHGKLVMALARALVGSDLFGDSIDVSVSWGHVVQAEDWECGYYVVAASEALAAHLSGGRAFDEDLFQHTLQITFGSLYARIAAAARQGGDGD